MLLGLNPTVFKFVHLVTIQTSSIFLEPQWSQSLCYVV